MTAPMAIPILWSKFGRKWFPKHQFTPLASTTLYVKEWLS
jgi:hypothetical protein